MTIKFVETDGAKILMLFVQFPSHTAVKLNIASELVRYGHEVHVILNPDNPLYDVFRQNSVKVISYRPLPDLMQLFSDDYEDTLAKMIFNQTNEIPWMMDLLSRECDIMMSDRSFLKRLKKCNFNYAVVEPFIINPCHILIPHHLMLPYAVSSFFMFPASMRLPALPSFYITPHPGQSMLEYPTLETFSQRLTNVVKFTIIYLVVTKIFWGDTSLIDKYASEMNSWEELILRSELILIENDHHLESPMPLLPHVVTAGGITARAPQPLAEDFERIMAQSGDHGVILASFGSVAYRMPLDTAVKFLDAFGRLKETVLTRMAVPAGVEVGMKSLHFAHRCYSDYSDVNLCIKFCLFI
jgi:hypothetical protein